MALLLALCSLAFGARIGDVTEIYGLRGNALQGVGVVIGLNKTGDSPQNAAAVEVMLKAMSGMGVPLAADQVKSRNVALVMVTAELPPDAQSGVRLDVQVASTGDARSLEGGTLLFTTLLGPDGKAYATARGALVIGGYSVSSGGESVTKNHPTVGYIPAGATVERAVPREARLDLTEAATVSWLLRDADFGNAARVAAIINETFNCEDCARAQDARRVDVRVPDVFLGAQVEFVAAVQELQVDLTAPSRVVINEKTGAVVMGANIVVHPVALVIGPLTIEVEKQTQVSQPGPLSKGETRVVEQTKVTVDEADGKLQRIDGGTVGDIVGALNDMGVAPREIIVILQMMKTAGAIDAPIVVL